MSTPTLTDLANSQESKINDQSIPKTSTIDSESQRDPAPLQLKPEPTVEEQHMHPLAQLSSARKHVLLAIFAVSGFVDVCNVSGVAVAVAQISADIDLGLSQIVWIITSYSLVFAAFLLFAGRLSDLFPAQVIFEGGFLALGIFSLITSFVTSNKYGFLILRGLGGLSGAMTIPSAYHLVVHMFPDPVEKQAKLGLLGLAGALGNILGLVLAGLCMLANYRWFFRLMAIICIVFSIVTILLLPYTGSSYSTEGETEPRWKRMDIVGVVILTGALICFILSLTQGPIDGWGSASFIAPFIIAFVLGPLFFLWESRIPQRSALLPSTTWKATNIIIASLATLYPFSFWATSQLQYSTYFQEVLHWSPIHVAAAMIPQGIIGLIIGGAIQSFPVIINKPRHSIALGAILIIAAEILQVYSDGGSGMNYWKFCFPAFILGSAGAIISYFAAGINLIQMVPPEMAGVASAWTQVLAQVGGAITLAVQAGLQGASIAEWQISDARGFWFELAFCAALALQYVIFYKPYGTPEEEHQKARKRIAEAGLTLEKE